MGWNTPRTWADEELVTANLLNAQLRDNLNALKTPPGDNYECDEASDYTTSSTSFVDVDATNLALTITTNGGDVLVVFTGTANFGAGVSPRTFFDVDVDGTREGGDDGLVVARNNATAYGIDLPVCIAYLVTGLAAGEHTFKLQWKTSSGTATLYAGAGTSNGDIHPQFWAREVS